MCGEFYSGCGVYSSVYAAWGASEVKPSTKDNLYGFGYLAVAAFLLGAKHYEISVISVCISVVYFKAAEIKDLINETRN